MTETVDIAHWHGAMTGGVARVAPPGTLAIVGAGRAGTALAVAAQACGYRVSAVHSRSPASARRLAVLTGARVVPSAAHAMRAAAITLVTVPDWEITRVAATVAATGMALPGRVVVHCAASRDRGALAALRLTSAAVGAAHPLQALAGIESAGRLRGSHIAIDADAAALAPLLALIAAIGGVPFTVAPSQRARYHAAAVLAGNAPLALLARATALLESAGVPPTQAHQALATLLEGAAANARSLGAGAALTGPVVRNDAATVAAHLHALRDDVRAGDLYRALARATLDLAGVAGREAVAAVLDAEPAPLDGAMHLRRRRAA